MTQLKQILNKALLTDADLEALGIRKVTALRNDRTSGRSILPYVRIGDRQIRYRRKHVIRALSGIDLPLRDLSYWQKNKDF